MSLREHCRLYMTLCIIEIGEKNSDVNLRYESFSSALPCVVAHLREASIQCCSEAGTMGHQ